MTHTSTALIIAVALAAGVSVQCIAKLVRIPAIVLLLAAGAVLGPEGLGWVRPEALGESLFVLVDFAVAIILFEGALNLDVARLRREERVIRLLVTSGALITLLGATFAARLWLLWPWSLAILFGALVVVTGPTVVGPLVRNLRLRPRLQTVLEAEGVFIDPIGALLAVLVLQVTLATDPSQAAAGMRDLVVRLVAGLAIGAVGGFTLTLLLRFEKLVRGLENILVLAFVTLIFHLGEHALSQSGLIAVTVAGVIVGNHENPVIDDLREFKDQLTLLLIGAIFILLAADVGMVEVKSLGWQGAAVVVTLIVVVRPISVWFVTRGAELAAKERVFLAAMAPRGIVAAAIASLMARTLDSSGIAGGDALRAGVVPFPGEDYYYVQKDHVVLDIIEKNWESLGQSMQHERVRDGSWIKVSNQLVDKVLDELDNSVLRHMPLTDLGKLQFSLKSDAELGSTLKASESYPISVNLQLSYRSLAPELSET